MDDQAREASRFRLLSLLTSGLGHGWARTHIIEPYGDMLGVPDDALPALLTMAHQDFAEMMARKHGWID
jgi:hypothetical protein